jgi:hypothetical protein
MNEVVKHENLSAVQVKENVNLIQDVLNNVMIKDTHYGSVPGCGNKPTLLKPGAEKILATFQIGTEIIVDDLSDDFDYTYRIRCIGFHIPTGNKIGEGIGVCSTSEKKYAWRKALCDEEYEATPETKRQIKYDQDYKTREVSPIQQVRQNPSDLNNTVLKMAKKRAMVDLCLTATACSDIFEQDLDEEHIREAVKKQPEPKNTKGFESKSNSNVISEGQSKRLYAIIMGKGYNMEETKAGIFTNWGFESTKDITRDKYEEIVNWVEGKVL